MPTRNKASHRRSSPQNGFSLPETLAAALLFAVSLLGLLQYHDVLQRAFQHQWQQRQAWRLVSQQLDAYEAGMRHDTVVAAPGSGWRFNLLEQAQSADCIRVTATAVTPRQYQAQLTRWFCQPATASAAFAHP
ncbi:MULTISPECIES: prepilin-type N-terminal cleavage/methylation domain-containing protein [unclassified Brenneria]|uniref:prepilin-type N-terminal cleavage/methylation domain-containing protein n=1 Tax=unclassified Brenneria TaxID=2634434 RepID=UPI0029C50F03|nr:MULTISPECIES: prepilin-type N-terminal cleavage/methylation domain-containing protein [unclassified Brenneria]MDX5627971.1 prepilin-type N-terminal cleavage/methylation domain-containing protein [Brenneria sp. L3-3Z]MDX5695009.1 prepilin-type N-terminal cleavage/methylation domain-containing protein [Brenneria sp. L4-2C]